MFVTDKHSCTIKLQLSYIFLQSCCFYYSDLLLNMIDFIIKCQPHTRCRLLLTLQVVSVHCLLTMLNINSHYSRLKEEANVTDLEWI